MSREDISFQGLHTRRTTYKADNSIVFDITKPGGSVSVGLAVKLVSPGTVGLTTDGSKVRGKLLKVEKDGKVSVEDGGFTDFQAGVGVADVDEGKGIVGALGGVGGNKPGYVRQAATPGAAYVEATAKDVANQRGEIADGSVLTKIWVDLG